MKDDMISRQAAINVIDAVFPVDPMKSEYAQGIACGAALAKTYVEQLPSAQPERKKGEWIIHETETDRYDDMKCPFCKKSYTVDAYRIDDIGFTAADFNFCPNCGADLRGEQDG